jgi:hypothetical protein
MNRLLAWGLVAMGLSAGTVVVEGTALVVSGSTKKETPRSDSFYYDLERLGNSQGQYERGANPSLRLVVTPARTGTAGLMLRVEVWNRSDEVQRVYPIDPITYHPEFRDADGKSLTGSLLPPALPRMRTVDEFARIEPGNCLATHYRFPTFYTRMAEAKGIECQVRISLNYGLDSKLEHRALFDLSSDWVKIPPP